MGRQLGLPISGRAPRNRVASRSDFAMDDVDQSRTIGSDGRSAGVIGAQDGVADGDSHFMRRKLPVCCAQEMTRSSRSH